MEKFNRFNKYHFTGQKPGEQILLVLHRHWFDIISQFFAILVMMLMIGGSYLFLPSYFPGIKNPGNYNLFLFSENLFFMMLWIFFFLIWVDYYFDVWIITDQRIVNIDQKGLFSRVVSELEMENIQDITTEVQGAIPTFLNFGNIFVQTAGERERFEFKNVPDPYHAKDLIMNLQKKYEARENQEFSDMLSKKIHHEKI